MAAFERGAHHLGVAGRVETVVGATVGQFDHLRDRLLARQALRIEEMRHPELAAPCLAVGVDVDARSEEHTSELQSLMRISYAVFCLKKKKHKSSTDQQNRNK